MMSYYSFLPYFIVEQNFLRKTSGFPVRTSSGLREIFFYSEEKQGRVAYSKMLTCHVKLTEPGGKRSPNKFTNCDAFSLP